MPYNPNITGSLGRSHSVGRSWAPKGVTYKARQDEIGLSKHVRREWCNGVWDNASMNPNAPPVIPPHATGHSKKPVKFPANPTPRHGSHEPHKVDRTGLTSSLPDLTRIRDTLDLAGANPHPQIRESYNPKKHSWFHPLGRRNQDALSQNQGPRSWAQDIKMSHNHIGYGNGILDCGEVQGTALSVEFPEWGCGPRQVPGPYGTQGLKGDRVGRFMKPVIQNGTQRTLIPFYKRGPNLSIIEEYFDPDAMGTPCTAPNGNNTPSVRSAAGSDPFKAKKDEYNYALQYKSEVASHSGSSTKSEYGWKKNYYGAAGYERDFGQVDFKGGARQMSNMHGGGCCVKRGHIPYSAFVEETPTIHMHA